MDLDGHSFIRRGGALVPADIHAEAFLSEIKEGREVMVTIRKARSPQHHRWFFAMLTKVCEAVGWAGDVESFLDTTKLAVGHVRPVEVWKRAPQGREASGRFAKVEGGTTEVVMVPKSINFGALDQVRFRRLVDRVLWVFGERFGIDGAALLAETDREQGGVYAAAKKAKK